MYKIINRETLKLVIIYLVIPAIIARTAGRLLGWDTRQTIACYCSLLFCMQFINSFFNFSPLPYLNNVIIGTVLYLSFIVWSIYIFIWIYAVSMSHSGGMGHIDTPSVPRILSFFICLLPSLPYIVHLLVEGTHRIASKE